MYCKQQQRFFSIASKECYSQICVDACNSSDQKHLNNVSAFPKAKNRQDPDHTIARFFTRLQRKSMMSFPAFHRDENFQTTKMEPQTASSNSSDFQTGGALYSQTLSMPAIHHRYEAAQKPAADESVEIGIQLF
jgi:hypothetical protein